MDFKRFQSILFFGYIYIFSKYFCGGTDVLIAGSYNIALKKPTEQGPNTWKGHNSSLAVDGDLGQHIDDGDCSHTKRDNHASGSWWKVDFERGYYVSSIRILRRDDVTTNHELTNRTGGCVIKGLQGNQEIYNEAHSGLLYNKTDINISVPIAQRNISFSGIRMSISGHFLTLCEVQVFLAQNCTVPSLNNGTITGHDGVSSPSVVPVGATLTYICNAGFTPYIQRELKCETIGLRDNSNNPPRCSARSCGAIGHAPPASNGNWSPSAANTDDTNGTCLHYLCTYTYNCKNGYNQSVSYPITTACNENGTWTNPEGTCKAIECPVQTTNAANYTVAIPLERYTYGMQFTAECIKGYALSSGNLNRTCLENGTWSGIEPMCTKLRKISPEASSSDNAAMIGGSVGATVAVIMALLLVAVFMYMRRKRQKPNADTSYQRSYRPQGDEQRVYSNINHSYQNKEELEKSVPDTEQIKEDQISFIERENKQDVESKDKPDEYYNISPFNKKSPTVIMLEDLADFVLAGKTATEKMETQFKALPTGMVHNHKAALKAENAKKNRYKQMYAYDDSRVVLKDCKDKVDTDYINASYINGFDTAKAYVASQGPTKDMINDFWRMIWQLDSGKIVMLTNLKEEYKMKCIQYWPDEGSSQFGSITVTIRDTDIFSDFVIRTLVIKQESSKEKVIHQFHFTAWPDRGVPKFSSAVVNFRNKVRNTKTRGKGPTIVHCSAGIGRTGTYIALDILTEQGKLLGYVDVASCIKDLRRQRVNMIQNLDQYVFLHTALTEALMLSSSAIPAAKFPEVYRELLQVDPDKRKRNIVATFDMLKHMSPVADETQYSSAREVRNKKNNRYSNILPVSEFMPTVHGSSKAGYINAVYLPSYKDRKALVLTQMPLENTKSDFWSLVREHHVHTIVMMNTLSEAEKEEIYWPDVDETQTYNNTDVETMEVEDIGQHTVVTMNMIDGDSERMIKQIQCRYWPSSQSLPKSPSDIIGTIELVQSLQQQSGNHPIVVHCMNGVDRSGLFCVIAAVIERLKIEQDVAITQFIEQMRCCRDQIIPSVEQFQFCHEVILAYIQQFNEYSNFSAI